MTSSPSRVLARVDDELRSLWAASPEAGGPPKSHACTMNLVVVAASPELAAQAVPMVDEVLQSIPARAIVVGLDPDGPDDLEASAAPVCAPDFGDEKIACSERVTIVARGSVCQRLPSCVDALCATDVPMTLVWLARVHADDPAFAPLAREASRIVVDAAQSSIASLSHVVRWARSRPEGESAGLGDLAWTRLGSWQELCSRVFDPPKQRDLVERITRITLDQAVTSTSDRTVGPEAALLLGWIATRLGWKTSSLGGKLRIVRADGGPIHTAVRPHAGTNRPRGTLVGVEIEASRGEASIVGTITCQDPREPDAAIWRVRAAFGSEAQTFEQHARLRALATAKVLERTLHRPPRDEALAEAALWADELRGEELASS